MLKWSEMGKTLTSKIFFPRPFSETTSLQLIFTEKKLTRLQKGFTFEIYYGSRIDQKHSGLQLQSSE